MSHSHLGNISIIREEQAAAFGSGPGPGPGRYLPTRPACRPRPQEQWVTHYVELVLSSSEL